MNRPLQGRMLGILQWLVAYDAAIRASGNDVAIGVIEHHGVPWGLRPWRVADPSAPPWLKAQRRRRIDADFQLLRRLERRGYIRRTLVEGRTTYIKVMDAARAVVAGRDATLAQPV